MLSWEKPFSRETEQWIMFKASVVSIEKWKFEMKKSLRKKDTTEPEAVKYVELLWTITQWIEHYLCNISMHILHTVLHTFLEMLERRTCLAIKSFFSWWSFPLSLWPSCLIKDGYWYAQVTPSSQRVKLNFL